MPLDIFDGESLIRIGSKTASNQVDAIVAESKGLAILANVLKDRASSNSVSFVGEGRLPSDEERQEHAESPNLSRRCTVGQVLENL